MYLKGCLLTLANRSSFMTETSKQSRKLEKGEEIGELPKLNNIMTQKWMLVQETAKKYKQKLGLSECQYKVSSSKIILKFY